MAAPEKLPKKSGTWDTKHMNGRALKENKGNDLWESSLAGGEALHSTHPAQPRL
jgi:hypothetical protein